MKLASFLREDLIQLDLKSKVKDDVIQELIDLITNAGEITNTKIINNKVTHTLGKKGLNKLKSSLKKEI